MTAPKLAQTVHYVSYGTPGGEYPATCRAAVITEVGQWVTVGSMKHDSYSESGGRPIRTVTQWFHADAVALTVLNPTGLFFNGASQANSPVRHAAPQAGEPPRGGTWHHVTECVAVWVKHRGRRSTDGPVGAVLAAEYGQGDRLLDVMLAARRGELVRSAEGDDLWITHAAGNRARAVPYANILRDAASPLIEPSGEMSGVDEIMRPTALGHKWIADRITLKEVR